MTFPPKMTFEISKIIKISKITKISKVSLAHKFSFPGIISIVKSEYNLETEKKFAIDVLSANLSIFGTFFISAK